jgi:hypothetical protein
MDIIILYQDTEFVPVDKQADHDVVHSFQLGEAYSLSRQPLNPCTKRQVLPLYLLGILLANNLLANRQMPLVGSPIVREKTGYPEWLKKFLQLQKDGVFAVAKSIGKDAPGVVVNRVPKPPLVALVADITPHLVQFSRFNFLNFNDNFSNIHTF